MIFTLCTDRNLCNNEFLALSRRWRKNAFSINQKILGDWWLRSDIRWMLTENHYDQSTGITSISQRTEYLTTLLKSTSQVSFVASEA